jgi:hypothetical protein
MARARPAPTRSARCWASPTGAGSSTSSRRSWAATRRRAGRAWRAIRRRGGSRGGAARPGRGHALAVGGQDHARRRRGPDHRRGRTRPRAGAGRRRLPMRALTRMWQMLLKALEEVRLAPNAMMAAEMAIIRLTHVAELPTPGDLVKKLTEAPPSSPVGRSASSGAPSSAPVARAPAPPMSTGPSTASGAQTALQRAPAPTSRAIPPGTASWRLSKRPGTSSSSSR